MRLWWHRTVLKHGVDSWTVFTLSGYGTLRCHECWCGKTWIEPVLESEVRP